ncbi:hypothetical protein SAMN06265349_101708 [Flavobacterium resistens]|uniref:Uncharacterized protein n=1 Tax=Flavobacterium resistens TaxID=443612 RepID=A0A521B5L2_9FLAO|nr:hypothetical protein [Flavobacterium resistens]MRX70290.1 hypothetical protein [Flavobacterium resistens]SMO42388.1 hypothetical protein SAMN06265349_101708 [Flavobacterium resistens]
MSLVRTYTVKMQSGDIWQFKYNLNGVLIFFSVLDGDLTTKQEKFLYLDGKFPWKEDHIKLWSKNYKTTTVEIGEPDLSVANFLKLYPYNPLSKKKIVTERFNKLKEAEKIRLFLRTPEYIKEKNKQNERFPYAEVYIHQRWWDQ